MQPQDDSSSVKLAVVTIGTCNRLAPMRVLLDSFRKHHPGCRCFAVVVDRAPGIARPFDKHVEVISCDDLSLPGGRRFLFKYPPLELCCALKPFALEAVLAKDDITHAVYMDSDMMVFSPFLDLLMQGWIDHEVLVTPHFARFPSELSPDIQLAVCHRGSYNGGFVAARQGEGTADFLAWWRRVVDEHCLQDDAAGLYLDQRWLEQAVSSSEHMGVLRDQGLNAAYWNLHERKAEAGTDEIWQTSDGPLRFFHFSGFDPRYLSKESPVTDPHILRLASLYSSKLRDQGHADFGKLDYGWARYANGDLIPVEHRNAVLNNVPSMSNVEDPFSLALDSPEWTDIEVLPLQRRGPSGPTIGIRKRLYLCMSRYAITRQILRVLAAARKCIHQQPATDKS